MESRVRRRVFEVQVRKKKRKKKRPTNQTRRTFPDPNSDSTFFTAGGGPLLFPEGSILNVPSLVSAMSSSADSKASRTFAFAGMRAFSHSTWSKSNTSEQKTASASASAAASSEDLGPEMSASQKTETLSPGRRRQASAAASS